jgi:hypothetical protein
MQTLLQRRSNRYYIFWVCVCSLSYPAHNAHAPHYIVVCGLFGSSIFLHLSRLQHDFRGEKLQDKKCVFWVSVHLVAEIFLILRRVQRDIIITVDNSSCKIPVILVRFWWKLNFLAKYLNIKFHENPSRGGRVVPCGRTYRHDETTSFVRKVLRLI